MLYTILKFVRSRSLDVFGLIFFTIVFLFAVKNHEARSVYLSLACMSALIAILLGPKISLKTTLSQIFKGFREGTIRRSTNIQRFFELLMIGFFLLFLYSIAAS